MCTRFAIFGALLITLVSLNAYADSSYAVFGYSGLTASNNLDINGTPYFNTDSGWISSLGNHGGGNTNYFSGVVGALASYLSDYFSFELSGLSGPVTAASFTVFTYKIETYDLFNGTGRYDIFGTTLTPAEVDSSHSFVNVGYYDALSAGPVIGSIVLLPPMSYTDVTITLNSAGLSWLEAHEGTGAVLGGKLEGGVLPGAGESDAVGLWAPWRRGGFSPQADELSRPSNRLKAERPTRAGLFRYP